MAIHAPEPPDGTFGTIVGGAIAAIQRGGWVGVDVFFVLSGFLVTGLLFREHALTGRIDGVRFLMRRGFKIYPLYYAFLLATAIMVLTGVHRIPRQWLLNSAVFIGNYAGSAWPHLWSLSVEEHFYVLLAVVMPWWGRRMSQANSPFAAMPFVVVGVAAACLVGRFLTMAAYPVEIGYGVVRYVTHLRVDSLVLGAGLAWIRQYHPATWAKLVGAGPVWITAGVGLLIPPFVLDYSDAAWFYPVGYIVYALGASALIVGAFRYVPQTFLTRHLSQFGKRSYAAYLVHYPIAQLARRGFDAQAHWSTFIAIYLAATVGISYVLVWTLEAPALRVRDRWFPSLARQRPATDTSGA